MKSIVALVDKYYLNLIIFLILFLSASFISTNGGIGRSVLLFAWAIVASFLLFLNYRKFHRNLVLVFFILVGTVVVSSVILSEKFTLSSLQILMLGISFIFVNGISFEYFSKSYVSVLEGLCLISLVSYFILFFFPSLNTLLINTRISGIPMSHFLVYVNNPYSIRNYGMFWEPGAFQAFISLALLLHCLSGNPKKKTFVIFIITSITTFSTTGYLTLLLILLLVLIRKEQSVNSIKRVIIFSVPVLLFLLIFFAEFLFSSDASVFGKLLAMIDGGAGASTTTSVRYYAVVKPLSLFLDSPIWGCGYSELQEKMFLFNGGSITCTPVNFFAVYGSLYGFIMILGYLHMSNSLSVVRFERFMIFFIFMLIMISENFIRCPIFIIIPLYSFFSTKLICE